MVRLLYMIESECYQDHMRRHASGNVHGVTIMVRVVDSNIVLGRLHTRCIQPFGTESNFCMEISKKNITINAAFSSVIFSMTEWLHSLSHLYCALNRNIDLALVHTILYLIKIIFIFPFIYLSYSRHRSSLSFIISLSHWLIPSHFNRNFLSTLVSFFSICVNENALVCLFTPILSVCFSCRIAIQPNWLSTVIRIDKKKETHTHTLYIYISDGHRSSFFRVRK